MTISRRDFIQIAATMGASLAWAGPEKISPARWRERRDLFPEGVASGDPDPHSVILWTRRPFDRGQRHVLTLEVAADEAFRRIVATAPAPVSAAADWTCRVLVAGLRPASTYWYRFTDEDGNGSRVGRTITAPDPGDARPVNFAFVSCQSVNDGTLNAYRRMIFEDEKAAPSDQLGFVLHLGDFIYEVVWYPEDLATRYDRKIYEVARIPGGEKVGNLHLPLTVEGYRAVYRGYLRDPDLQDARARWPFVAMWDNHEFSWQGWQSIVKAGSFERPGQTVKVAANQAWFEYLPARVARPNSTSLESFEPPAVKDVAIERFDADGLGDEPNNRIAIDSLKAYRALRYGRQYFREISGNGIDFGYPVDGKCTLAYSRILDDSEIVIALNLAATERADYITVDAHLNGDGAKLKNLLDPRAQFVVEARGRRNAVKVPLAAHSMAILRQT